MARRTDSDQQTLHGGPPAGPAGSGLPSARDAAVALARLDPGQGLSVNLHEALDDEGLKAMGELKGNPWDAPSLHQVSGQVTRAFQARGGDTLPPETPMRLFVRDADLNAVNQLTLSLITQGAANDLRHFIFLHLGTQGEGVRICFTTAL